MKYFFRIMRWPLGQLVILVDFLTRPDIREISPEKRVELDNATSAMSLYQFQQCPFCVKTRRAIRQLGLNIETRDARRDARWKQQLIGQGGKYQVPCLHIVADDSSEQWLYESRRIIEYLENRFG